MDKQSRSFVQAVKDAATEFAATRDERRFDYSVTSAREAVLNYVAVRRWCDRGQTEDWVWRREGASRTSSACGPQRLEGGSGRRGRWLQRRPGERSHSFP